MIVSPESKEHNLECASSGLTSAEHITNGLHSSLPGQLAGMFFGFDGPVKQIMK